MGPLLGAGPVCRDRADGSLLRKLILLVVVDVRSLSKCASHKTMRAHAPRTRRRCAHAHSTMSGSGPRRRGAPFGPRREARGPAQRLCWARQPWQWPVLTDEPRLRAAKPSCAAPFRPQRTAPRTATWCFGPCGPGLRRPSAVGANPRRTVHVCWGSGRSPWQAPGAGTGPGHGGTAVRGLAHPKSR